MGIEGQIIRILGMEIKKREDGTEYGLVHVIFQDGQEATVFVGGHATYFYNKGQVKAHVSRSKNA